MHTKHRQLTRFTGILLATCLVFSQLAAAFAVTAEEPSEAEVLSAVLEAADSEQLQVGAAVRDITPTKEMYPIERKSAGDLAGVIDPLHVRVIALTDGREPSLIVSTETGRGPYGPQFIPILADATGVREENIFLTATHSHAAPEITSAIDFDDGSNLANWGILVRDQMIDAANEAIGAMRPAEVGIGYSDSYTNANRNATYTRLDGSIYRDLGYNGGGFSDKLLTAIEFRSTEDQSPIAFIVSHATHGVVMHANEYFDEDYEGINYTLYDEATDPGTDYELNVKYCTGVLGVSSDLPGYVSTYLEEKYTDSVALYLCGAAGDQNPIVMNEIYAPDPETGEATTSHIEGGSVEILEYLAAYQFADVLNALGTIEDYSAEVKLCNLLESTDVPAKTSGTTPMYLQMLRIGDIALMGTTGEFFNSIGVYMRDHSDLEHTLVVNCVWNRVVTSATYYADDDGILNGGSMTSQAPYTTGVINEYMSNLVNDMIGTSDNLMSWVNKGDGTATNPSTGETVIVGLDGIPGTQDDNRIVSPAQTVLLEDAEVSRDSSGAPYVDLGNGFHLYGGADGLLGTTDDVVVGFGAYYQAADGLNKEPLNWRLLDIVDNQAILMSEMIVDGIQYNLNATDGNAWVDSNLRTWLNSTGGTSTSGNTDGFYDTAFTAAEKEKIALTRVSMNSDSSFIAYNTTKSSDWWEYYTTAGVDTEDYVWSLSGEEAFGYYGRSLIATEEELGHAPENYTNGYFYATEYAKEKGGVKINTGGNGDSFYGFSDSWTRSPGREVDANGNYYGVFWGTTGSLNSGRAVSTAYGAIPVITVNLSAEQKGDWQAALMLRNIIAGVKQQAATLDSDDFTPESWAAFAAALEAAQYMADNYADYTAAELEAAGADLLNALSGLVRTANRDLLVLLVEGARDILKEESKYLAGGVTNLKAVLAEAEAVLGDPGATQAQIDEACAKLISATTQLLERGDQAGLQSLYDMLINLESALYTADSWAVFEAAMADAAALLARGGTAEEIAAMTDALYSAFEQLQTRANKEALQAAIATAEDLLADAENYTTESLQGLERALNNARAVDANPNATQAEVDAALDALAARLLAVRVKPTLNSSTRIAYLQGYPDGTVRPENAITRAEVATIFNRLLTDVSVAEFETEENSFTDVDKAHWANTAISTLANAEILMGYGDGTFMPEAEITRGEFVTIVSRFYEAVDVTLDVNPFSDISGHWATESILFAAEKGLVVGYEDGTFKPNQPITRAEAVTVINEMIERRGEDLSLLGEMTTFSDNQDSSMWYYKDIQLAANPY